MATYLSVDLDYWGRFSAQDLHDFIAKTLELRVPKCLVYSHEMMLDHINSFSFDRLINVDYHSDLCRACQERVADYNWSTFVLKANRDLYEWRFPSYQSCVHQKDGLCDLEEPDLFQHPERTNWRSLVLRQGLQDIPWEDVVAVGFCPSFEYWNPLNGADPVVEEVGALLDFFGSSRSEQQDVRSYTTCKGLIGEGLFKGE